MSCVITRGWLSVAGAGLGIEAQEKKKKKNGSAVVIETAEQKVEDGRIKKRKGKRNNEQAIA